jgi:hypothetical protein
MSAVLLAMFTDYPAGERTRLVLVRDGFPTDRVELTACCDPGRAGLAPALSPHERFIKYFGTLFCHDDERPYAEHLTQRLEEGAAAVIVQPRGPLETLRAREILEQAGPLEMVHHDLAHQSWEYAAARHERPWIRAFWTDSAHGADCLYCRLFERPSH